MEGLVVLSGEVHGREGGLVHVSHDGGGVAAEPNQAAKVEHGRLVPVGKKEHVEILMECS